jgi:hypothetical protein
MPLTAPVSLPRTSLPSRRHRRWRVAVAAAAVAAVGGPYLVALGSPLRMTPDSVTYLAKAIGIAPPPHHQRYPPGYPALLSAVVHLGFGTPTGFVALNVVMLIGALGVVYRLCRRPLGLDAMQAALVCLAVGLSHAVSLVTPLVMSDIPYFALAMVCLLALTAAERRAGRQRRSWLALAAVLAAAGISIRWEGVALIVPVVFVAVGAARLAALWRSARRRPAAAWPIAAVALAGVITAAVLVVQATPYAHQFARAWHGVDSPGSLLLRIGDKISTRLIGLGELGSQIGCCQRVRAVSPALVPAVKPALALAGVAVLALLVIGGRTRRRVGAIDVFVLATGVVVVAYGGVSRFWIPALPFMLVYGLSAAERLARPKWAKAAFVVYAVAFALAGGAWLIEGVAISTSGRRFPERVLREIAPGLAPTYRVAFGQGRPGDEHKVDRVALTLLRRFEPLARDPRGVR